MNIHFIRAAVLAMGLLTLQVQANENELTSKSQQLMSQLEDEIVGTLLEVARIEQAEGKNLNNLEHSLVIPAKNYVQMGMLIDTTDLKVGFKVVSVTQGGAAEKAGVRVNDVITEINGSKINELESLREAYSKWFVPEDKKLKLQVARANASKSIVIDIPEIYLPEITLSVGNGDNCGVVNVLRKPPNASKLNNLVITKIGSRNIDATKPAVKLVPGKHQLRVEMSGDSYPSFVLDGGVRSFEIDIKANTKYYIAGRVTKPNWKDKLGQYTRIDSSEWQVVVWETETIECSL